jgi:hypothetical protein
MTNCLQLLSAIDSHIDDVAQVCLNQFQTIRSQLANQITLECPMDSRFNSIPKMKIVVAHAEDILVAEVCIILLLNDVALCNNVF